MSLPEELVLLKKPKSELFAHITDSKGTMIAAFFREIDAVETIRRYNAYEDLLDACQKLLTAYHRGEPIKGMIGQDAIESATTAIAEAEKK